MPMGPPPRLGLDDARTKSQLTLWPVFYGQGFRWPLRDGDVVEVWLGTELLGVLPLALLRTIIAHHLSQGVLQVELQRVLSGSAPGLYRAALTERMPLQAMPPRREKGTRRQPMPAGLPFTRDQRQKFRARRRGGRGAGLA